MDSNLLNRYLTGTVNGMEFTPGGFAGRRDLSGNSDCDGLSSQNVALRVNRWANIIAGLLMTFVQAATLLAGTPAMYYLFCSVLEIAATVMIVWFAWNWRMAGSSLEQKGNQE